MTPPHLPHILSRALTVVTAMCMMLGCAVTMSGSASAEAACIDGSRPSAAAIAKDYDQRVPEPRTADAKDGDKLNATVKLRYAAAPYHCVWALIAGPDGATTWIDRRRPGAIQWEGPLGMHDIRSGNGTTYSAAYNISGYEVRACGNWSRSRPAIFCTDPYSESPSAPVDAGPTPNVPGGQSPTVAAPVTGSPAALAQQILDLDAAGKITISPIAAGEGVESDKRDHSLPKLQLEDIANGKLAQLSSRCSYASKYHANPIEPDPQFLRFLIELGQNTHYKINVLFGQCHPTSAENSFHHRGQAADFACGLDTGTATAIGRKYGVSQYSGETCIAGKSYAAHWHYSVGGH